MIDREEKSSKKEAEEVKEILNVVSSEVPAMIKSILATVFSPADGKKMERGSPSYDK